MLHRIQNLPGLHFQCLDVHPQLPVIRGPEGFGQQRIDDARRGGDCHGTLRFAFHQGRGRFEGPHLLQDRGGRLSQSLARGGESGSSR